MTTVNKEKRTDPEGRHLPAGMRYVPTRYIMSFTSIDGKTASRSTDYPKLRAQLQGLRDKYWPNGKADAHRYVDDLPKHSGIKYLKKRIYLFLMIGDSERSVSAPYTDPKDIPRLFEELVPEREALAKEHGIDLQAYLNNRKSRPLGITKVPAHYNIDEYDAEGNVYIKFDTYEEALDGLIIAKDNYFGGELVGVGRTKMAENKGDKTLPIGLRLWEYFRENQNGTEVLSQCITTSVSFNNETVFTCSRAFGNTRTRQESIDLVLEKRNQFFIEHPEYTKLRAGRATVTHANPEPIIGELDAKIFSKPIMKGYAEGMRELFDEEVTTIYLLNAVNNSGSVNIPTSMIDKDKLTDKAQELIFNHLASSPVTSGLGHDIDGDTVTLYIESWSIGTFYFHITNKNYSYTRNCEK